MPSPRPADLSDLDKFIYCNSILMPQITQKEILQAGHFLRAKKNSQTLWKTKRDFQSVNTRNSLSFKIDFEQLSSFWLLSGTL